MVKVSVFFAFLICLIGQTFAQEDYFLTPQNKAYIFHTVRKSPILQQNIGRYITYSGKEIKLPNASPSGGQGEINYDSIEQVIINQPDLLKIYSADIRRAPKGILAELANKMALWELNKLLQAHRSNELEKEGKIDEYEAFEKVLFNHLPADAIRERKGKKVIDRKVDKLSNPTLTFNDKIAMLDGFTSWSENEKKEIIDAYNIAFNDWVGKRAFELFKHLGGEASIFTNVLTAAGDGSSTSGLFEEREQDERGRWNKGLPKAVGLFPYESYIGIDPNAKKKKPEVLPMGYTIHQFETAGNGKKTVVHMDVWGYNSEKQTTVVLEKKGKYYPLFGSSKTRFLSPDSTFGEGTTYYSLIQHLKRDIQKLEEKVSGRRGLDYWIEYHEERRDDKKLDIDKTEHELTEIRYTNTTTNNKKYTTNSQRKKRKKRQDRVVLDYSQLESIKKKIKELKEDKEIVLTEKQALNRRLQNMYDLIGSKWVPFEAEDGYFLFEDSARFDLYTQEFTFPPSDKKEVFEVTLIAIPLSYKSTQHDEVMLHINVMDAIPYYTSQVKLELQDVFEVDRYQMKESQLLKDVDSIAVMEFFEAVENKKKGFDIIARGQGIGKWKNNHVVKDPKAEELTNYPGKTEEERQKSRQDSTFLRLRNTSVNLFVDRCIVLEVNSYTDPVTSNFIPPKEDNEEFMKEYKLQNNDLLSAYRTYATLKELKNELNVLAGEYLSRSRASTVIDRINKAIDKSRISVGISSIKYKDF